MYNQRKTIFINIKHIKLSIKYANTEYLTITNNKCMIWIDIYDHSYTPNNIVKLDITPEKHSQQKQLIYHLILLQISKLYLIYLKQYQLQLFVPLKVLVLIILLMILHNLLNVQYILYYMIIKINIIYIYSSQLQLYRLFTIRATSY